MAHPHPGPGPERDAIERASSGATRPRASFWAVLLAVIVAVFLAGGVAVLTLGAFSWVIALGLCLFLFAALHYVVWGWWLSPAIHREVAREEAARAESELDEG